MLHIGKCGVEAADSCGKKREKHKAKKVIVLRTTLVAQPEVKFAVCFGPVDNTFRTLFRDWASKDH